MSGEKLPPGGALGAFGGGVQPVLLEHVRDGAAGHAVSHVVEGTPDGVYPQSRFSVAIRTISRRISCMIGGRPGPRRPLPSYFFTIVRTAEQK